MWVRISIITLCVLVAGCNETGQYPAQCDALLPGWKKPSDGYFALAITNKVHVLRDGTLNWNDQRVTDHELRTYAGMLPGLNPVPFTILDIEPGTSCDRVRVVRQILNDGAKCRQLRTCGEGLGPWAQIGDVIGPNGETYKYYPDGRSETIQPTEEQRAALNAIRDEADAALKKAEKQ